MGLPPIIRRVTSCLPSLMVGSRGCFVISAAATRGPTLARTVAPVVMVAVCLRNCRRLLEVLAREDMRPSLARSFCKASATAFQIAVSPHGSESGAAAPNAFGAVQDLAEFAEGLCKFGPLPRDPLVKTGQKAMVIGC